VSGGKRISREIRGLMFRMAAKNPTWGAPRIHSKLLMLGFDLSERTSSRWMRRAPRGPEPAQRWLSFLYNHLEATAAMDFFTIPTVTFNLPYCFSSSVMTASYPALQCQTTRRAIGLSISYEKPSHTKGSPTS
jgi:hypothetical protein